MKINKRLVWLGIGLIGVFFAYSIPNTASYTKASPEAVYVESGEVKSSIWVGYEDLKVRCSCESTGKPLNEPVQFKADGSVIKGIQNPLDTGACQVNLKYHQSTAISMGYDLFKELDNILYSQFLFDEFQKGRIKVDPWNWSRSCWGAYVHS